MPEQDHARQMYERIKKAWSQSSPLPKNEGSFADRVSHYGDELVVTAYIKHRGNQVHAAKELGLHRNVFHGYLARWCFRHGVEINYRRAAVWAREARLGA